jgi:transposase
MHTEFTREQFRREVERGMAFNVIAKKLGVGRTTVFRWHRAMDLPRRARGSGAPCHRKKAEKRRLYGY